MRPVFNDLLTELQRSLSFFSNVDRNAKLGRIVALGNAFKLPGLRRYLSQSLGFDIKRVESFRGLEGPEVIERAQLQGKHPQLRRLLRAGVAGAGQGRAEDQPAAQANRPRPADSPEEALGRGRDGHVDAGLRPGLRRLFNQLERGEPPGMEHG